MDFGNEKIEILFGLLEVTTLVHFLVDLKMRNKVGGNKAKKMGRKHAVVRNVALVVRTNALEHYGYVDKIFGGRLCSAVDTDGKKFKVHIRGKFKSSAVVVGSIILFGEREFASSKEDCDLLFVYEEKDFGQLVGVELLLEMRNCGVERGGGASADTSGLSFSMDAVGLVREKALEGRLEGEGEEEEKKVAGMTAEDWDSI